MKLVYLAAASLSLFAADPTPAIRNKLSAADLPSAESILEEHRLAVGRDASYWTGLSWLARGAAALGEPTKALAWAREIRAAADWTQPSWNTPLGAAIEVEARTLGGRKGVEFLKPLLVKASGHAIESRLWKVHNVLTLVGQPAPAVAGVTFDKPTILFFWAHWCGDCKAQAAAIERVMAKHPPKSSDVRLLAPTRTYPDQDSTEEQELAKIAQSWKDTYSKLPAAGPIVDRAAMIRYGVSSTPTFVAVDAKGIVRAYTPTRLTDAALESLIAAATKR